MTKTGRSVLQTGGRGFESLPPCERKCPPAGRNAKGPRTMRGQGARLFPRHSTPNSVDSQSTPKGVTIQDYRPTGCPQYVGRGQSRG
jgi:hypothetical protein